MSGGTSGRHTGSEGVFLASSGENSRMLLLNTHSAQGGPTTGRYLIQTESAEVEKFRQLGDE